MVLYLIVLAVKGIYPFGAKTIDYYDMAQQIAAFYYHVYDMLHGSSAFYYNWYSALGVNMAMSTSGCSNLSLFNLFFLFIPRHALLESLSFFQLLKMLCMTLTMYIYVHKTHKAPYFFEVAASVGYAFCGFVLVLHITNQWMDIAVLFPLMMLFYDRMLRNGRIKGYVITLSLILIASYYLGFMILIFLFLYTGIKIFAEKLYVPVKRREHLCIMELGVGTVTSLALSSFIVVPQLTQMLSSARFANGNEGEGPIARYFSILSHVEGDYTTRWWSLLGISMAVAVILIGMIKDRKNRYGIFMTVSMILLMVLELFFESINLIWHFGSYVQYPIRNGFIIYFVFAYLICFYAERLFEKRFEPFGYVSLILTVVAFTAFVILYKLNPGLSLRTVFHITSAMMAAALVLYIFFFAWDKGKYYSCALGIICLEILCYAFLLFGKPDFITGYAEEPEQEGEYIRICNQLTDAFELEPEYLFRVKNPDESLNANYGFVLRRPALSNWTHMIAPDEQRSAANWGYSIQFTRLLDSGGTVFSDALLGVRDIISCVDQDPELYEKVKSAEIIVDHMTGEKAEYTLYKAKYTLPFAIPMYVEDMYKNDVSDLVELHNIMYRSMTGADTPDEQKIAQWYIKDDFPYADDSVADMDSDSEYKLVKMKINISGKRAIYLNGSGGDNEYANTKITVTDSEGSRNVLVPTIKDVANEMYPAHFNNNTIYIGSYEDEEIEIVADMNLALGDSFKVSVCGVDLEKMKCLSEIYSDIPDDAIVAGKNTLGFTVDVGEQTGDTAILLPLEYDKGWTVKINDKKTEQYSYAGLFTVIPLWEGINKIDMKFVPKGMGLGICISILTLLIIGCFILARKASREIIESETEILSHDVEHWITPIYLLVYTLAVFMMYVIPVVYGMWIRIFK